MNPKKTDKKKGPNKIDKEIKTPKKKRKTKKT